MDVETGQTFLVNLVSVQRVLHPDVVQPDVPFGAAANQQIVPEQLDAQDRGARLVPRFHAAVGGVATSVEKSDPAVLVAGGHVAVAGRAASLPGRVVAFGARAEVLPVREIGGELRVGAVGQRGVNAGDGGIGAQVQIEGFQFLHDVPEAQHLGVGGCDHGLGPLLPTDMEICRNYDNFEVVVFIFFVLKLILLEERLTIIIQKSKILR